MKIKLLVLMILLLAMPTGYSYAWSGNDNSDRLSSDQAGVFSPGYLNAAKQQAYSIVNQNNKPKSWWENLVDKIKDKVSNKVEEQANTKVQPEIKKKTSAKNETTLQRQLTTENQITIPPGMGTDKKYDDNGRLISEVFDGKRYVYAGFTNVGKNTIADAIAVAEAGDIVAVKAGDQNFHYNNDEFSANTILKSGVSLYGGYSENGVRDIIGTPTTIIGGALDMYNVSNCEINGFTFKMPNTAMYLYSSQNISITNNTFTSSYYDILIGSAYNVLIANNKFTGDDGSFQAVWLGDGSVSSSGNNYYGTKGVFSAPYGINTLTSVGDYFSPTTPVNYLVSKSNVQIAPITQNFASTGLAVNQNPYTTTVTTETEVPVSNEIVFATDTLITKNKAFSNSSYGSLSQDSLASIFKGLLANKNAFQSNMATPLNEAMVGRLVTDSLASAVGVPSLAATEGRNPEIQMALALANILRNPTEDQKAVLDAVESLLTDMKNLQEKAGVNTLELTKAESDLLQMVASVLLAQGVPDLLKAGDIEGVKGIFKDLGQSKDKIILGYNESIKPYYDNIVKELSANMAMLQLKGMLSKKITEDELKNLEPREIDRIIESIRKYNDKSFELEYILQQDAKYRKEYLDPQSKVLQDNMRLMLNSFTKRINSALEEKK